MAYGFVSYNDSGFLQISEDFINLRVMASGTASHPGKSMCVTADNWNRDGVKVTFPSTTAPMILIQARSDCHVSVSYVSSTEFVFTLTTTSGPFNGTISYKVLGTGTALSTDTYGLRFWGSQGQLIFDSGSTYAKGVEVLTCPLSFGVMTSGYFRAQASTSIASLTYSGAPWIFCNPMGPIFMFWLDWVNTPSLAYSVNGVGFKYSTGAIHLGSVIHRTSDNSYLTAAGGEPIGDNIITAMNYTYNPKFIVGEVT